MQHQFYVQKIMAISDLYFIKKQAISRRNSTHDREKIFAEGVKNLSLINPL